MQPLVLALVDSVFALALHHDLRARQGAAASIDTASVRAEVAGPELQGPAHRGLLVRITLTQPAPARSQKSVSFQIDLEEERLLAKELSLAELPLDRSGLARLIGELEAWCYAQIPLESQPNANHDSS